MGLDLLPLCCSIHSHSNAILVVRGDRSESDVSVLHSATCTASFPSIWFTTKIPGYSTQARDNCGSLAVGRGRRPDGDVLFFFLFFSVSWSLFLLFLYPSCRRSFCLYHPTQPSPTADRRHNNGNQARVTATRVKTGQQQVTWPCAPHAACCAAFCVLLPAVRGSPG